MKKRCLLFSTLALVLAARTASAQSAPGSPVLEAPLTEVPITRTPHDLRGQRGSAPTSDAPAAGTAPRGASALPEALYPFGLTPRQLRQLEARGSGFSRSSPAAIALFVVGGLLTTGGGGLLLAAGFGAAIGGLVAGFRGGSASGSERWAVLAGVGGITLLFGVPLLAAAPYANRDRRPAAPTASRVAIAPLLAPGLRGAGALVAFTF